MKVFGWLIAVSVLGAPGCSRSEPAPSARAAATPPEEGSSASAPAPPTPAPPTASAPPGQGPHGLQERPAGSFAPVVDGLSVLASERVDADGVAHEWTVVRVDLRVHRLQVRARGEAPFADQRGAPDVLVAVNGGFFDPALGASGRVISEGVALASERPGGGSGVLIIAQGLAHLQKRGAALPAGVDFALQCGPRLIEPGGAVGIRSDDGQRAARTAACIRDGGRELDLIVAAAKAQLGGGPGLLQLARWLAEPLAPGEPSGCEAALNLDGGPSTALVLAQAPELFRAPLGPVPFVLVVPRVVPRPE